MSRISRVAILLLCLSACVRGVEPAGEGEAEKGKVATFTGRTAWGPSGEDIDRAGESKSDDEALNILLGGSAKIYNAVLTTEKGLLVICVFDKKIDVPAKQGVKMTITGTVTKKNSLQVTMERCEIVAREDKNRDK